MAHIYLLTTIILDATSSFKRRSEVFLEVKEAQSYPLLCVTKVIDVWPPRLKGVKDF